MFAYLKRDLKEWYMDFKKELCVNSAPLFSAVSIKE